MSGDGSHGLSEIIHDMEKKLDSAQKKFNPTFGKRDAGKVNQFDISLEDPEVIPEKSLKRSQTVGSTRRATRDPKTPPTMERTGANNSVMEDDGDDAYTPQ